MNIVLAIVEDRTVRESLRAAIPKTDLLLLENSVDDALRRMVSMQADVILLDDGPRLGMDALPALRDGLPVAAQHGRRPGIVVLSGRSDMETTAAFMHAGAERCLPKPFRLDDLQEALKTRPSGSADQAPVVQAAPADARPPRELGQHQMALRWMSRNTAYLEDPTKLCDSLVDAVVDILDASRAAVLVQHNGGFRVGSSHGIPAQVAQELSLSYFSGLMRRFETQPGLLDRTNQSLPYDVTKEINAFGGRIALPLLTAGRTCGALIVGDKISGGDYDAEERELLAVMVRCTSACLEKARRYREISRQQSRLDAVLSNLRAGVVTVDPDGRITMLNESAEHILQLRANDVLGRRVQKLGSAFADVVLRSMESGQPLLRQEIRDVALQARLGLSVTPLGPEGAVAMFTRLPEQPDTVDDAPNENVEFSPIWEHLSARVAQEIKNPMVAISTFAQLLPTRYDSNEFRDEFYSVVQSEVGRINQVVDLLYSFARRPRLDLQRGDLNETVRQVLDGLTSEIEDRGVEVKLELCDAPLQLEQDPLLLAQAVHNVMHNAIEAMPQGGRLSIATVRDNGNCTITISDTGPGVPESARTDIFQPFFSTKETGMGLGLTMAHRIVRQHEGTLEYVNGAQSGAEFRFTFPAAAVSHEVTAGAT